MFDHIEDPYFRVEVLAETPRPNLLCYLAMHQDYSENATADDVLDLHSTSEPELGRRIVTHCLKPGHWGILEHASITVNVIGFPHSVMVQARTHRVGVSFDCQSMRYTGKRIVDLAGQISTFPNLDQDQIELITKYFYFRPIGFYQDRQGDRYYYDEQKYRDDLVLTKNSIIDYSARVSEQGYSEEHARDFLVQNVRQHFVVTFNARSLLHFCDLRFPKDAQLEIRSMTRLLWYCFEDWMPEVAEHYQKTRLGKNKLAP